MTKRPMIHKKKIKKKRRDLVDNRTLIRHLLLPVVALSATILFLFLVPISLEFFQKDVDIIVYKSRLCSCSSSWVKELRNQEFTVKVKEMIFLESIRRQNRVPKQFSGCHTAYSNGFFIEGHVPADHIRKLILDGRHILGVALPEPLNGLGGDIEINTYPNEIIIFDRNGKVGLFGELIDILDQ